MLCNACVFGVSGRSRQAAGLVGIVLTSVICVCLSGTRQHHGRETDTLQRVTELKPGTLCLEGGRRGGGLLLHYTDLIPAHTVQ